MLHLYRDENSTPRELIAAINRLIHSLKLSAEQQEQQSKAIGEYIKAQDGARDPDPPVIRSEVQIPPEIIQRYEANQGDQARIQTKTYRVSVSALIVLFVYTAFTGWTVCEIRKQNASLSAQVGLMQKQLELTERPWISTEAQIASSMSFDDQGAHIKLRFVLNNIGHSPAMGVSFEPELYILNPTKPHPTEERKRLCDDLVKRKSTLSQTVFPGKEPPFDFTVSASRADIEKSRELTHGAIAPAIITCIAYRPTFTEDAFKVDAPYFTGMIYDVTRFDSAHPNSSFVFLTMETVPVEQLRLQLSYPAGIVAQ